MRVDKEAVETLAELLSNTGLTEIEIAEGDNRIRVARTLSAAPVQAAAPVAAPAAPAAAAQGAPAASSHPGAIKSPIVGVAYLTPDPSSPPFAKPGDRVEAGQTLLLIEAMKTFNQIKAPKSGVLREYCVQSGEPVEFDAVLAIVE